MSCVGVLGKFKVSVLIAGSNRRWTGNPGSNGAPSRELQPSSNGSSPAVTTAVLPGAEVAEQQQALRQLQNSAHELQMRLLRDQQALGRASAALQVHSPEAGRTWVDQRSACFPEGQPCPITRYSYVAHFATGVPPASLAYHAVGVFSSKQKYPAVVGC